jgi:hypothetical protein
MRREPGDATAGDGDDDSFPILLERPPWFEGDPRPERGSCSKQDDDGRRAEKTPSQIHQPNDP